MLEPKVNMTVDSSGIAHVELRVGADSYVWHDTEAEALLFQLWTTIKAARKHNVAVVGEGHLPEGSSHAAR